MIEEIKDRIYENYGLSKDELLKKLSIEFKDYLDSVGKKIDELVSDLDIHEKMVTTKDGHWVHGDWVCYVDRYRGYYLLDDCVYSERGNEYIPLAHATETTESGWIHDNYVVNDYSGEFSWHEEDIPDDFVFCSDVDDYVHIDDAHWSESHDCYYYDEDLVDNRDDYGVLNEYHCCLGVEVYRDHIDDWTIGFEIEKSEIVGESPDTGDEIPQCPLISYWTLDGSCGYEGITHAYSLENKGKFAYHIGLPSTRSVVNGSNISNSCGGHVNINKPGGFTNLNDVRPYLGLLYALYRFRLKNSYCNGDKEARGGTGERYCAVRVKNCGLIEFRLVSAVKNTDQLEWRYDLFNMLMQAVTKGWSFRTFLDKCRPLLKQKYGSRDRLSNILNLSRKFQTFLDQGVIDPAIAEFI